ncbi:MAG: ComEC family DNA internalization-related competence protein, partial [Bacteroidetes bacterium]|nr:ComEC family DNA internalization-related competence protein [Bacteroidota bacterium]
MSRQPLLIALLLFATGILVVEYTTVQLWLVITPLVISILLLFFILLLNVKQPKVKLISISLFMFSLGMFFHYFNNQHPNNPYQLPQRNYVFQLEKKLNSNSKYKRYEVSILTTTRSGQEEIVKSVVSLPKETRDLDYKHYYSALIYLKKVELPKHDFQFNYAKYLYRQKIEYQGWINGEIQSAPKKMTFSDQIRQWRLETLWKISESNLQPTSKEFAKGIILADRTEMGQEMTEDFSKTGLVHFLAISGTH